MAWRRNVSAAPSALVRGEMATMQIHRAGSGRSRQSILKRSISISSASQRGGLNVAAPTAETRALHTCFKPSAAPPLSISFSSQFRRSFRTGFVCMEDYVMKVPDMGDSISEGTLVEWNKAVGEYVKTDEVICVIETDKVSIDVRSPVDGTVSALFAELDTEVTVGSDLVKLDTDGAPPAESAQPSAPAAEKPAAAPSQSAPAASAPSSTAASAPAHDGGRVPSIKFLGKRSLLPASFYQSSGAGPLPSEGPSASGAVDFDTLPELFGHLHFSEEEIEAINTGGATALSFKAYTNSVIC